MTRRVRIHISSGWQTCYDEVPHERLVPSGHPVVLDDIGVVQQTEEVNLKSDEVQMRHFFMQSIRLARTLQISFSSRGCNVVCVLCMTVSVILC